MVYSVVIIVHLNVLHSSIASCNFDVYYYDAYLSNSGAYNVKHGTIPVDYMQFLARVKLELVRKKKRRLQKNLEGQSKEVNYQ